MSSPVFSDSWSSLTLPVRFPRWLCGVLLVALSLTLGCGSGAGSPTVVSALAPAITAQPDNQATRVGQSATFTVVAGGTTPLTYQWTKNGTTISGATGASYTTPLAMPADNGAIFEVTVSNAVGSATSSPAKLTVGPRAPMAGDLRFQQVAAASTLLGYAFGGLHTNIETGLGWGFPDAVGTPLTVGAVCDPGCVWFFGESPLSAGSGLTINYHGFDSTTFPVDSQLDSLANGSSVFTSLDVQPAFDAYAVSWMQSSSASGFTYARQSVAPGRLQAVATQLGQQGSVITAISFDASGNACFVSYGWIDDPTTAYDVAVDAATLDSVATEATSLAAAGYIITALGGNPTNGFLLVGTRVHGDTMPRPLTVISTTASVAQIDAFFESGDAIVGYITNADQSNTYIGEQ